MTHLTVLVEYSFLKLTCIQPNIKYKSDFACMLLKSSCKGAKEARKDLQNTLVFKRK